MQTVLCVKKLMSWRYRENKDKMLHTKIELLKPSLDHGGKPAGIASTLVAYVVSVRATAGCLSVCLSRRPTVYRPSTDVCRLLQPWRGQQILIQSRQ